MFRRQSRGAIDHLAQFYPDWPVNTSTKAYRNSRLNNRTQNEKRPLVFLLWVYCSVVVVAGSQRFLSKVLRIPYSVHGLWILVRVLIAEARRANRTYHDSKPTKQLPQTTTTTIFETLSVKEQTRREGNTHSLRVLISIRLPCLTRLLQSKQPTRSLCQALKASNTNTDIASSFHSLSVPSRLSHKRLMTLSSNPSDVLKRTVEPC